jgi:hypothetical protein
MGWLKPTTRLHDGRVSWEGHRRELKIYREAFEGKFLDSTEAFYAKKAATWITTDNVSEYIEHVNSSLDLEKQNGKHFLEDSTTKLSIERIVNKLVTCHAVYLVDAETGCDFMLDGLRITQLHNMYRAFKHDAESLVLVVNKMIEYIKKKGLVIIEDK